MAQDAGRGSCSGEGILKRIAGGGR
jgi:hypothetical protein